MQSLPKKSTSNISDLLKPAVKNFTSWNTLLVIAVALGSFLRFYRVEENIIFHGELGHNYLAIKNFIAERKIPLLGPPTSHPWLSFGPLFYWIMAPILHFSNYDPRAGAYLMAAIGSLVIILNYAFIEKLINEKVAILSSYLIAISPAWLDLTRQSRFYSLTAVFFYPFLYFLMRCLQAKNQAKKKNTQGRNLFWTGFFLSLMLNFHLTPLAMIPAVLTLFYLPSKRLDRKILTKGFLGLLIPNIPFLLFNALNKFTMLTKLVIWIPYRFIGFLGLYPKNTVSLQLAQKNLLSFYEFFQRSIIAQKGLISVTLVFVIFIFILLRTLKEAGNEKKNRTWLTLVTLLVWQYLALFVHGNPPSHYYVAIYPLPILFLGLMLGKLLEKKLGKVILTTSLVIITFLNLKFFFSQHWLFKPQGIMSQSGYAPFNLQLLTAKTIIKDAGGRKFSLSRVGPFDYFEGNYAQNYQYLLWWLRNEPVSSASLKYTIYENTDKLPKYHKGKVFWIENLAVLRED